MRGPQVYLGAVGIVQVIELYEVVFNGGRNRGIGACAHGWLGIVAEGGAYYPGLAA